MTALEYGESSGAAETPELTEMTWDPITRIVGSLGIYTKIDFKAKRVAECHSTSSIFRGYSIFMKGKDPRDAHFITSRICGICGDNHCTCSCLNQNMAYGVKPPPLGDLPAEEPRAVLHSQGGEEDATHAGMAPVYEDRSNELDVGDVITDEDV